MQSRPSFVKHYQVPAKNDHLCLPYEKSEDKALKQHKSRFSLCIIYFGTWTVLNEEVL